MTVKEVKAKELPPLDDDLAIDSRLRRPRGAARRHLRAPARGRRGDGVEAEFRQAALDAAVAGAAGRAHPRAGRGARAGDVGADAAFALPPRDHARGLPAPQRQPRGGGARRSCEPEAELALRREAVITAVVAAEGISPSDEDVLEVLAAGRRARGDRAGRAAGASCARAGSLEEVREELAARQAIDLIAERRQADRARAGAGQRAAVDAREGRPTAAEGPPEADKGTCTAVDRPIASL